MAERSKPPSRRCVRTSAWRVRVGGRSRRCCVWRRACSGCTPWWRACTASCPGGTRWCGVCSGQASRCLCRPQAARAQDVSPPHRCRCIPPPGSMSPRTSTGRPGSFTPWACPLFRVPPFPQPPENRRRGPPAGPPRQLDRFGKLALPSPAPHRPRRHPQQLGDLLDRVQRAATRPCRALPPKASQNARPPDSTRPPAALEGNRFRLNRLLPLGLQCPQAVGTCVVPDGGGCRPRPVRTPPPSGPPP
jgi:hypothetical protein